MAYLVPYELALKPGEEAHFRAYLLQETVGIPHDTYQLQEWYCPNPMLDPSENTASYALTLRQQIAEDLNSDPAYIFRLRIHYNQVKAVAADPYHPAYPELTRWANEGFPKSSSAKRKRKRHA